MRDVHLIVRLRASFTEVGTLELWCEARDASHRWRLQFELRGEEAQAQQIDSIPPQAVAAPQSWASSLSIESAAQMIRSAFANSANGGAPYAEGLVSEMETALGLKKDSWPIFTIRQFSDVLAETAEARKKSAAARGALAQPVRLLFCVQASGFRVTTRAWSTCAESS